MAEEDTTCPTACDDDCTAKCHEGHYVLGNRQHDPAVCEDGMCEDAKQAAEIMQASQDQFKAKHGYNQNGGEFLHRLAGALIKAGWRVPKPCDQCSPTLGEVHRHKPEPLVIDSTDVEWFSGLTPVKGQAVLGDD